MKFELTQLLANVKVPHGPLVVESVLASARTHLSRAERCRIHPSPSSFDVLAIGPGHVSTKVEGETALALGAVRCDMKFGDDVLEDAPRHVEADVVWKAFVSTREITVPLTGNVIRNDNPSSRGPNHRGRKDVVHI